MKVQYLSDLHVEHGKFKFENINNAEVLIIAGDGSNGANILQSFEHQKIVEKWKHIIYILGNHEYYINNKNRAGQYKKTPMTSFLKFSEKYENFHVLDNESITLDDITFYGGTLWFDYDRLLPMEQVEIVTGMNDSKFISTDFMSKSHREFLRNLDYNADVIISHHGPSINVIDEQYKHSKLNRAYYTDLTEYILQLKAKYWISGHVHNTSKFLIGDTVMISNPRGYTRNGISENPNFDTNKCFEINKK